MLCPQAPWLCQHRGQHQTRSAHDRLCAAPKAVWAMQPVCSLRVDGISFKQAAASWTRRHILHQRHRSSTPNDQERPAHGPAHHKLRPRRVACSDAAVPNIPFPGDNQSAAAFAALRSSDEVSSSDSAEDSSLKAPSNGAPAPDDKPQPRIPHRWRIVGMMALAFVLCNMDKVQCILRRSHWNHLYTETECQSSCCIVALPLKRFLQ